MTVTRILLTCSLLGYLLCTSSQAATVPDGKIIVRVEDGAASRCINSTTDRITMHLRRLVINKDAGFFSEDKTAAVIVSTVISGEEGGMTPKKVTFPRMYVASVAPYSKGIVSVPIEEKLFSRFPLTGSGNSYDTAEVEFTILSKKDKTPFGIALSALADISKNLPAPVNPFSEGFKYFSDYANKVIEGSITTENNIKEQSKEGKMILSFSSTSTCVGDQEKTGTLAIVGGAEGKESDGIVDIKKDYCWRADLTPVFTLKFAPRSAGATCAAISDASFTRVNNAYTAFFLNAEPKVLTSSQTVQEKTLVLPTKPVFTAVIDPREVEKLIIGSYEPSMKSHTASVKSVTDKVSYVLKDEDYLRRTSTTTPASDKLFTVTIPTTAIDGLAIDLAESLRRCVSHGIKREVCL